VPGLTISKIQTRLLPETAYACLCLKSWMVEELGDCDNKNET